MKSGFVFVEWMDGKSQIYERVSSVSECDLEAPAPVLEIHIGDDENNFVIPIRNVRFYSKTGLD